MTDQTKRVDRGIPPQSRTQSWTNVEASAGDVLLVETSLGHCASQVKIEAGSGDMGVRFNVYHTVYQRRPYDSLLRDDLPNVASGLQYHVDTARVDIRTGTTFILDDDFPVSDIELITASGSWNIFVA